MPMCVRGEIYKLCQVEDMEKVKNFRHMLIIRAIKMINRQSAIELQYSKNSDSCSANRGLVSLFLQLGGGL